MIVDLYFNQGKTMEEIAGIVHCSVGFISSLTQNVKYLGTLSTSTTPRPGRPRILDEEDCNFIESILLAQPAIYLDEIQAKLSDIRGVHASLATISRMLRNMAITRKKVSKAALERNEELRKVWEMDMAQYEDPEMFVAIDESAVDNKTGQRSYGWSDIDTPCVRCATFLRGERLSILPALTVGSIIALDIIEGSVTSELFLRFIREQVVCSSFLLMPDPKD